MPSGEQGAAYVKHVEVDVVEGGGVTELGAELSYGYVSDRVSNGRQADEPDKKQFRTLFVSNSQDNPVTLCRFVSPRPKLWSQPWGWGVCCGEERAEPHRKALCLPQ